MRRDDSLADSTASARLDSHASLIAGCAFLDSEPTPRRLLVAALVRQSGSSERRQSGLWHGEGADGVSRSGADGFARGAARRRVAGGESERGWRLGKRRVGRMQSAEFGVRSGVNRQRSGSREYSVLSTQYSVPSTEPPSPSPQSQTPSPNLKSSIEETALAVEALLAACPPTPDPRPPNSRRRCRRTRP